MNPSARKISAVLIGMALILPTLAVIEGLSTVILKLHPPQSRADTFLYEKDIAPLWKQYSMAVPTTIHTDVMPKNRSNDSNPPGIDRRQAMSDEAFLFHDGAMIGYKPNASFRSRVVADRGVIYDVLVTINEFGHRSSLKTELATQHALFMGCSFTFGQGVADDETLPSEFSRLNPQYQSYNFGMSGQSAAGTLAQMKLTNWSEEIKQPKGFALFTFISDQVNRAVGTSESLGAFQYRLPSMRESGDLNFEFQGPIRSPPSWRKALQTSLRKTSVFKLFKSSTLPWSQVELDYYVRLVAAIRQEYLKKFPDNNFFFVFFPKENDMVLPMAPVLQKYQIPFLVYPPDFLWGMTSETPEIVGDGHLSAAGQRAFAELLTKDLPLGGG